MRFFSHRTGQRKSSHNNSWFSDVQRPGESDRHPIGNNALPYSTLSYPILSLPIPPYPHVCDPFLPPREHAESDACSVRACRFSSSASSAALRVLLILAYVHARGSTKSLRSVRVDVEPRTREHPLTALPISRRRTTSAHDSCNNNSSSSSRHRRSRSRRRNRRRRRSSPPARGTKMSTNGLYMT